MGIVGRSNDQLHKDLDIAEGNVGALQTDISTAQGDIVDIYKFKTTITHNVVVGEVTTGKATITLTADENLYSCVRITDAGPLTSVEGELIISSYIRNLLVINEDDQDYKVWLGSGNFSIVPAGHTLHLYCDGANVNWIGGIINGSNANGSYTKFADGTLICTYIGFTFGIPNTTHGSIFTAIPPIWTFPHVFINKPSVTGSNDTDNRPWITGVTSLQTYEFRVLSALSISTTLYGTLTAVGKWK